MKTYFAVTSIVMNKGKVLILKKSPKDWNYPNKWSFCSGYAKEFEAAEETSLREIKEETGLNAKIARKGKLFETKDGKSKKIWIVVPFLCKANSRNVRLDHENVEYRWISRKDIKNYPTVPGLEKDLKISGLI
ncbi:NUDIX hydrolase [Candidatus Woesearchaeota archaeon]|nr:NUDIX hydrolase [Candidatus Woesearchaeota archaeon]